ncbi:MULTISPECIES: hypothetical protein [unclassified Pseudoalteromonas]|uniref:hypothetical protein n=1 Tax=unclassified Pseudoalteromonas TaxID=194690 RepID=UPI0030144842
MIKKLLKPARKLHKYLGYLLFLQILAWLLGGLVMSAIPLDKVHGNHLAKRTLSNPFIMSDYKADLNSIASNSDRPSNLSFSHFLDTPIIKLNDQQTKVFNGLTGTVFQPPTRSEIIQQANAHLLIDAQVIAAVQLQQGAREVGHRTGVWQVTYDDMLSTTLYLDASSGEVITVRSNLWRIFDFFWMLHIMDYQEREDFNNPLLISFAATSVLFALSGVLLLLQSPPRRGRRKSKKPGIKS